MALPQSAYKDRQLLAVIGDEDSVTGLLLAGIGVSVYPMTFFFATAYGPFFQLLPIACAVGTFCMNILADYLVKHVTPAPESQRNFLIVDHKTETSAIEQAFDSFTKERKDIGILMINQHIAERIRHRIDTYTEAFPSVLEIPSKDHPYDPEKDSVLRRVRRLFGE